MPNRHGLASEVPAEVVLAQERVGSEGQRRRRRSGRGDWRRLGVGLSRAGGLMATASTATTASVATPVRRRLRRPCSARCRSSPAGGRFACTCSDRECGRWHRSSRVAASERIAGCRSSSASRSAKADRPRASCCLTAETVHPVSAATWTTGRSTRWEYGGGGPLLVRKLSERRHEREVRRVGLAHLISRSTSQPGRRRVAHPSPTADRQSSRDRPDPGFRRLALPDGRPVEPGPLVGLLGHVLGLCQVTGQHAHRTHHSGRSGGVERLELVRGAGPAACRRASPSLRSSPPSRSRSSLTEHLDFDDTSRQWPSHQVCR